jgi:ectoine hydroxylase-related dioxygenase (phytanoyl-CoA dioxygenase family)
MSFEAKHVDPVDDVIKYLAEDGVVIMDNVLDKDQIAYLGGLLRQIIEEDRRAGVLFQDEGDSNERMLDITARHKAFRDLVELPLTIDITSRWLKPKFRLSSFGANVTTPGSKRMFIHTDQLYVPAPWPPYPLALNLMWILDDYTLERGATHIMPGSHRTVRGPDITKVYEDTVPVLCDAGSLILMDGRVWHHTGPNTTADQKRAALLMYFVNWFIIPQTDWATTLSPEVRNELSPLMRELLGFGQRASMVLEPTEGF